MRIAGNLFLSVLMLKFLILILLSSYQTATGHLLFFYTDYLLTMLEYTFPVSYIKVSHFPVYLSKWD